MNESKLCNASNCHMAECLSKVIQLTIRVERTIHNRSGSDEPISIALPVDFVGVSPRLKFLVTRTGYTSSPRVNFSPGNEVSTHKMGTIILATHHE